MVVLLTFNIILLVHYCFNVYKKNALNCYVVSDQQISSLYNLAKELNEGADLA